MKQNDYYLVVFQSKNHALLIYKILESKGYDFFKLVSTPCFLKSGCSYSIKVMKKIHLETLNREVEGANIKNPKFYYVEKINGKSHYKEINQITY